ncbi:titin [Caerostris extrusa]|uniref:Titin n=1 Tax=Caerostris extrusa TaxID=172846 RepID=A0AAV4USX7_CAEEX|nr:titin [Caerostris extrusa]
MFLSCKFCKSALDNCKKMRLLTRSLVFSFTLSIISGDSGAPKIKPFHFTADLNLGMRESVHCAIVYGDPPFEFSWLKDGKSLLDVRSVSIRKTDDFTSNLVISKVDADSNGNYTCRVSNSNGLDEKSAILSVKRFVFASRLIIKVL